jgi:hypothetical protein
MSEEKMFSAGVPPAPEEGEIVPNEDISEAQKIKSGICPSCGGGLAFQEGCKVCYGCGWGGCG